MNDDARLRAWWFARQGLDGSLAGAPAAAALARSGWARSVGGASPYLSIFARTGAGRAAVDAELAAIGIHELPSARGCTYVLPAADYALGLAVGEPFGGAEMATARRLGVTDEEVERLSEAVLAALADGPRDPDAIRAAVGDRARALGEAGKKKGLTTTLPLALGRLQVTGAIRRVPVDGRLDRQRYAYARWTPSPRAGTAVAAPFTALAERFFRWVGPATLAEFQWFSGLGVKAVREAVATLGLVPADDGGARLLLADDVEAWRTFAAPAAPCYALVGSLDALVATRRELQSLVDAADRDRAVLVDLGKERPLGGLSDLPSHAIVDRGRLVGLWEFDPGAGTIAWATFAPPADADALAAAVARTERFVRDDLGDARNFSLDSPERRAPRIAALRRLQGAA